MPFAKVNCDIYEHPKTQRAARDLGLEPPEFVGYLSALWNWCFQYVDYADLTDFDAVEIANAARWRKGDPERFREVLISRGWLVWDEGRLRVKGWNEHTGKVFDGKSRAAIRQKNWRERQKAQGLPTKPKKAEVPDESPETESGEAESVTPVTLRVTPSVTPVTPHNRIEEKRIEKRSEYNPPTPFEGGAEGDASGATDSEDETEPFPDPEPTSQPETVTPPVTPETERTAEKKPRSSRKQNQPLAFSAERVLELWNEGRAEGQPAARSLDAKRRALAERRIREFPNEADWITAIAAVRNWAWGNGQNDSRWFAHIDWFLSPSGLKAFEGALPGAAPAPERKPRSNAPAPRSWPGKDAGTTTTYFAHLDEQ